MPATSKQKVAANQYAQAMLELANERNQAVELGNELRQVGEILCQSPDFALFLRDPGISQAERRAVIGRAFADRASELMFNLLGVLNGKGRMALLDAIIDSYQDMLNQQLGRIDVDVTVARTLDAPELEFVRQRINAAMKKDAIVRQRVDDRIIGGMVLRIGDKLMDASVRSQLDAMRRKLMAAAPQ